MSLIYSEKIMENIASKEKGESKDIVAKVLVPSNVIFKLQYIQGKNPEFESGGYLIIDKVGRSFIVRDVVASYIDASRSHVRTRCIDNACVWHSHPGVSSLPSSIDYDSFRSIANLTIRPSIPGKTPIFMIFSFDEHVKDISFYIPIPDIDFEWRLMDTEEISFCRDPYYILSRMDMEAPNLVIGDMGESNVHIIKFTPYIHIGGIIDLLGLIPVDSQFIVGLAVSSTTPEIDVYDIFYISHFHSKIGLDSFIFLKQVEKYLIPYWIEVNGYRENSYRFMRPDIEVI